MKISKQIDSKLKSMAETIINEEPSLLSYGKICSEFSDLLSEIGLNLHAYKFDIIAESIHVLREYTIAYWQYLEDLAEKADFHEYKNKIKRIGPDVLVPLLRMREAEVDRVCAFAKDEMLKIFVEYRLSGDITSMANDELKSVYQKVASASTEGLWKAVLDAEGVQEEQREHVLFKIRLEIARATRPKWQGRLERGGELATLSAPEFLKIVHAEEIATDGTVYNEVIRAIDPDLMRAVEVYISARLRRGADLGNAEGLNFVLSRPSRRIASLPPPQSG